LLIIASTIQLAVAIRLEISSNLWVKFHLLGIGPIIMVLLGANAIWDFSAYAFGIYLIGVFWHVMQVAILFVKLIAHDA